MQKKLDAYEKCLAATEDRSRTATAEKNKAKNDLSEALRNDALYCSTVANGDEAVLLQSGFLAVSTNHAQSPVGTPVVRNVDNSAAGALKVRVASDRHARSFVGRIREAKGGEFGPAISFSSSRKIVFNALKRGVDYVFQISAVGGSNDQSDWSDPVENMAS